MSLIPLQIGSGWNPILSPKIVIDCGVKMGEGFIDALNEPLTPKPYIENESRLEHGKQIIVPAEPKFEYREVTLNFVLCADSPEDLQTRKETFMSCMYKGKITLSTPAINSNIYYLIYTGKGSEYGMDLSRKTCKLALKFIEPDPTRRNKVIAIDEP